MKWMVCLMLVGSAWAGDVAKGSASYGIPSENHETKAVYIPMDKAAEITVKVTADAGYVLVTSEVGQAPKAKQLRIIYSLFTVSSRVLAKKAIDLSKANSSSSSSTHKVCAPEVPALLYRHPRCGNFPPWQSSSSVCFLI